MGRYGTVDAAGNFHALNTAQQEGMKARRHALQALSVGTGVLALPVGAGIGAGSALGLFGANTKKSIYRQNRKGTKLRRAAAGHGPSGHGRRTYRRDGHGRFA